jgi:hypothetical protein
MSPIFYEQLFHTKVFLDSFYVLTIRVCNFLAKGFWRKSCSQNVGEIETWWQKLAAALQFVVKSQSTEALATLTAASAAYTTSDKAVVTTTAISADYAALIASATVAATKEATLAVATVAASGT